MQRSTFFKPGLTFLLLVVLALSLRLIYFRQTVQFLQPAAGSDSYFYLQWARDILRGNIIGKEVFYALPLYPYFLSLTYLFSGGETFGLILIQLLIGSLNCGLIYILGKRLLNVWVGIIASLIACTYSMFIFYDRMLLPASLAIFLGLLLALLLLKVRDNPSLGGWFAVGVLLGLGMLASASVSLLGIFILFWLICGSNKGSFRQRLLYCTFFILSFFLIIGGITLRNYLVAGDPVLITAHSGINFYIGNNSRANGLFKAPPYMRPTQSGLIRDAKILAEEISGQRLKASAVSNFWLRRSLNFIRTHPLNYLGLLGKKLLLFWNGKEYVDDIEYYIFNEEIKFRLPLFKFSLICPLGILGMFLSWPLRKRAIFLYFFVVSLMLASVLFFINSRYRLMAVPYLVIFAGFALWQIFQRYKNRQYKDFIFSLVLFFTLYFLVNIKVTATPTLPNFTFHYNRGVILSERGQYQKARKEFRAALRLNPFDFMSFLGLGNIYYKKRDYAQAIDNYKRAKALNPYFCDAYFNLGFVYNEIGLNEEAEQEFKRALQLNPDDCAAHYNLGRIYQKKGLTDLALKEYEQALKIEPAHQEILQAIKAIKQSYLNEK